jgi:hypothetical protein
MIHTHIHLHVALTRKENGRSPGTFQKRKQNTLLDVWKYEIEKHFCCTGICSDVAVECFKGLQLATDAYNFEG